MSRQYCLLGCDYFSFLSSSKSRASKSQIVPGGHVAVSFSCETPVMDGLDMHKTIATPVVFQRALVATISWTTRKKNLSFYADSCFPSSPEFKLGCLYIKGTPTYDYGGISSSPDNGKTENPTSGSSFRSLLLSLP